MQCHFLCLYKKLLHIIKLYMYFNILILQENFLLDNRDAVVALCRREYEVVQDACQELMDVSKIILTLWVM